MNEEPSGPVGDDNLQILIHNTVRHHYVGRCCDLNKTITHDYRTQPTIGLGESSFLQLDYFVEYLIEYSITGL